MALGLVTKGVLNKTTTSQNVIIQGIAIDIDLDTISVDVDLDD